MLPVVLACLTVVFTENACWWWRLEESEAQGEIDVAVLRITLMIGSGVKERVEKAAGKLTWSFGRLRRVIYPNQEYDSLKMREDETR